MKLLTGSVYAGYTLPAVAYIDAEGTVMEITTGDISRQSIVTRLAKIGVSQKVKDSAEVLLQGEYRQTEARRELDIRRRTTWEFSPVTKVIGNKKRYNRKKTARDRFDDGADGPF